MQKILVFLLAAFSFSEGLFAEGGSCALCERIREENKKKVNEYEYYEDYLKDHPEEANKAPSADDSTEKRKTH